MAIYTDSTGIKDLKRKLERHPDMLATLGLYAFCIGEGNLTEDNITEWVYRINRHAFEGKPLCQKTNRKPFIFTEKMLKPWIGLKTNIVTMTNKEFDDYMRKKTKR